MKFDNVGQFCCLVVDLPLELYYFKFFLEAISTSCADELWRGGGWGKHISLDAIFEGKHTSLVICVRGNTYHGGTHITVTAVPQKCTFLDEK